jgi:2-octaprenyl-6-methoxyphenol hydroxylase
MSSAHHDVIIVGGGLVGASLAIALDRIGVDVGLVEATPAGALPSVFDERNLSFAEATVNALTTLGVMQKLQLAGAPIRRIHVSRTGDFGRVQLDASDHGRESFGQVVVARDFGHALEARLVELTRLARYRLARFVGIDHDPQQGRVIRVTDDSGDYQLSTRLLVAADGTHSGVRDALEITTQSHDYAQTLFVARVRSERAPDGTAYERFGDDGPTAMLPRSDRHFGAVHGVPNAEADAVALLEDAEYLARLQRAFGWRVGRLLSVGARSRYPATCVRADRLIASRAVLVGNAAQTLHPIGAQGFNLGLRDALTLSEVIEAAQDELGSDAMLAVYDTRRQDDRERTIAFSDGLARLTANPSTLLRPLRALGLLALDRLPSLQSALVGGAMGYRGEVPVLCRAPS